MAPWTAIDSLGTVDVLATVFILLRHFPDSRFEERVDVIKDFVQSQHPDVQADRSVWQRIVERTPEEIRTEFYTWIGGENAANRSGHPLPFKVFFPPMKTCQRPECDGRLATSTQKGRVRHTVATCYGTEQAPFQARVYVLHCDKCKADHALSYWWEHNDVGERKYHYYADQSAQPYFQSNRETLIGRQLLLQTLFSVVNAHMAYNSSADTYNDTVQNLEVPRGDCPAASTPRFHLDDRRLREASFKWMLRRQVERVGKLRELELGGMEMHHFDQALETTWNKVLYQHFVATWGRKHRCATPGCGTGLSKVVVVDGNMKIRRRLCSAPYGSDQVTHTFAKGGTQMRGCERTPAKGDHWCLKCTERVVAGLSAAAGKTACAASDLIYADLSTENAVSGKAKLKKEGKGNECSGLINLKLLQDKDVVYEVEWLRTGAKKRAATSWHAPWELAPALIADYHERTGIPLPDGYAAPPDLKAIVDLALMRSAKVAEPVDLGSIAVDSTDEAEFAAVACQTQKDDQHLRRQGAPSAKDRPRARTAGVVVATFPCLTTFAFAELYGAESCSQVYAFLLETWCLVGGFPGVLAYDDACHLSKYVLNGVRFCVDNVNVLQRGFARFTQFVVDPFHFPNHKDQDYCKEFMDPGKVEAAKGVNMESCEQRFHWLSGFRPMMIYMNKDRFRFFLLIILEEANLKLQTGLQPVEKDALSFTAPKDALADTSNPSLSAPFRQALAKELKAKGKDAQYSEAELMLDAGLLQAEPTE